MKKTSESENFRSFEMLQVRKVNEIQKLESEEQDERKRKISESENVRSSKMVQVLRSDPTGSGRTEGRTKVESGGQLSTVHHRTRAGETSSRTEEM